MKKKPTCPPLDDRTGKAIAAEYAAGDGVPALMVRYQTSQYRVREYLKNHGFRIRTRGEATGLRNRKSATPIDEAKLRLLIDEKLSTTEIAAKLGVSQPTIEMKLRRIGLNSKHGRGSRLEKNYFWNGGRVTDEDGYILLKQNDHPFATKAGYVREHRLVMEAILGRYLDPLEVVHHKNKNKADNRPDNLELYKSNADHLRDELTGVRPKYTEDGLRRMRENALRVNRRRYGTNPKASKSDAPPSP